MYYNQALAWIIKQLLSKCRLHTLPLRWILNTARVLNTFALESPKSKHLYDVVRSYFVDLESLIEYWIVKNKIVFQKNLLQRKEKDSENFISMVRAFHPINYWISIFTFLGNTIRRRYFDHNCLIIFAWPCNFRICTYLWVFVAPNKFEYTTEVNP